MFNIWILNKCICENSNETRKYENEKYDHPYALLCIP